MRIGNIIAGLVLSLVWGLYKLASGGWRDR